MRASVAFLPSSPPMNHSSSAPRDEQLLHPAAPPEPRAMPALCAIPGAPALLGIWRADDAPRAATAAVRESLEASILSPRSRSCTADGRGWLPRLPSA
eukprot:CAMPEP_0169476508 /NCGR_PEP_ID=MMETSP1042-20121227/27401_1 /TAXON_ID=464988 /ORGANISM="Hemiselmis andersenii, Strain CCMP1180" /LENGTH=97 /DNA_ID=CAMNT_0009590757 /DNA_START=154 /DNA_END=443 /DNA_ORIENTATION=+